MGKHPLAVDDDPLRLFRGGGVLGVKPAHPAHMEGVIEGAPQKGHPSHTGDGAAVFQLGIAHLGEEALREGEGAPGFAVLFPLVLALYLPLRLAVALVPLAGEGDRFPLLDAPHLPAVGKKDGCLCHRSLPPSSMSA